MPGNQQSIVYQYSDKQEFQRWLEDPFAGHHKYRELCAQRDLIQQQIDAEVARLRHVFEERRANEEHD